VHEYGRRRDYERGVRLARRAGWRVVSVLQRPALPGTTGANGGAAGLRAIAGAIRGPWLPSETEYLVTFRRPLASTAASPAHARGRSLPAAGGRWRATTRWLWVIVAILLVALLAYGLLSFFGDAVAL
jgi:hypothetical protein